MEYRFFIGDGTPLHPAEDRMIDQGWNEWITRGSNQVHAANQTKLGNQYPSNSNYQPQADDIMVPCPDGYKYLSYKRKESCKWALANGFDYMFCASVDVYARPERLMTCDFRKYDYYGMLCGNTGWPGTKSYLPESYVFGGGYWLSAKAAKIIAESPVSYWCEDWWVGMALSSAVKNGKIVRCAEPANQSKFCLPPKYPHPDNDLISVELSAGNYNNLRMYGYHERFIQAKPDAPSPQSPPVKPLTNKAGKSNPVKILVGMQACQCLNEFKTAQRRTWLKGCPVDYKFFMGKWQPPNDYFKPGARMPGRADDKLLFTAPKQKPDEVWLDIDDRKQHLSEKAVLIVRWAYEQGYDYLFKCDVDTHVHIARLLASEFEGKDYVGRPVDRVWRGRWTMYAQGGAGFWMSRRAMEAFLAADQSHIPYEDAEDIRTGWLLMEQGIKLFPDFRYEPYLSLTRSPHPQNDVISTHKVGPEQMFIIDRRFQPGY
jgi:hypothetical protein